MCGVFRSSLTLGAVVSLRQPAGRPFQKASEIRYSSDGPDPPSLHSRFGDDPVAVAIGHAAG